MFVVKKLNLLKSLGVKASDFTGLPENQIEQLIQLYYNSSGDGWTDNTGWLTAPSVADWFGLTVASQKCTVISLGGNNLAGDITSFDPSLFVWCTRFYLFTNALLTGSMAGWVVPSKMQHYRVHSSGLRGVPSLALVGASIRTFYTNDCGWNQAEVDGLINEVWDIRNDVTWATPVLNVGGSNAAPGGIYQAACPPTTGKEMESELENDSCAEGFIKWTVIATA